jgi:hypothetical protein
MKYATENRCSFGSVSRFVCRPARGYTEGRTERPRYGVAGAARSGV